METVTRREILVSIAIVLVLLTIGSFFGGKIQDWEAERTQEYNTASKIDNRDLFEYGMRTSIGNAFVYGTVKAVDPVTYDEIGGEYSYVKRVYEEYRRHTRTVTRTRTVNGKTQTYTTTETYWSWDAIRYDSKHATAITFLDVKFDYGKISVPSSDRISTQSAGHNKRYVYYGSPTEFSGTAYCELKENDMNVSRFYYGRSLEDAFTSATSSGLATFGFWIAWSVLTAFVVVAFVVQENKWCEG